MFPFDLEDEEEVEIEEQKEPKDWEIDFKTGKLTGRVVTGFDAIKQWVRIALSIDRYTFPQYTWDYGNDLSSLIGKNYDEGYIKSEAKRMIEDALSINDDILGIEDFECSFKNDKLIATFKLNTKYGGGVISV